MKSLYDGSSIFLLFYVDDMLIAAKSMSEVNKLKTLLSREFDMKDLCETKKILGMQIRKGRALGRFWLVVLGRCWRGSTRRIQNQ